MAKAKTSIRWVVPPSVISAGIDNYGRALYAAVGSLFQYYAPVVESHAKALAPWQDRTGNARQALFTVVEATDQKAVLYLSHGVSYGVFLELRYQGRYSVVLRALDAFHGPIMADVKEMLK